MRKGEDVPNLRASASDVVQATIWFPSANYLRTFHAILANRRGTLLQCVKELQLSGRQLRTIHQLIQISCSSNILPAHRCILLLLPSMSLSKDIRILTSLHRSSRCDWLQMTSQDRACWSAVCRTLAALNLLFQRDWRISLVLLSIRMQTFSCSQLTVVVSPWKDRHSCIYNIKQEQQ